MNSTTFSADAKAAANSGWPKAAMSAPSAIALAISKPLRIPPEATKWNVGQRLAHGRPALLPSGIPQSAKVVSARLPCFSRALRLDR